MPRGHRFPNLRENQELNTEQRGGEGGGKGSDVPASRPTTESFSQFDPEALTRYLKPIIPHPRGQRTASNICVNRFANRRPVTHADRLVSNGPPPHPMTTISKLGSWSTISPAVPLAAVEVEGDPCSSPSPKAPTLIRQTNCSRFSRCAHKLEMETRKQGKYIRPVCFDSLADG